MDARQDQRIADGLRAGDVGSWHALYDEHAEAVWAFTARRLGSARDDTPDVVQEVFLEAARSARSFDPSRGGLKNWLFGIARRRIAGHFRSQARHQRSVRPDAFDEKSVSTLIRYLEGTSPDPPEILERAETSARIRRILAELPPDYESLLSDKYVEQKSLRNMAEERDATLETVRSKLARARRAFKKDLEVSIRREDGERAALVFEE
jgi:RNA polymerase sigma-70 factor, ECF subfamily